MNAAASPLGNYVFPPIRTPFKGPAKHALTDDQYMCDRLGVSFLGIPNFLVFLKGQEHPFGGFLRHALSGCVCCDPVLRTGLVSDSCPFAPPRFESSNGVDILFHSFQELLPQDSLVCSRSYQASPFPFASDGNGMSTLRCWLWKRDLNASFNRGPRAPDGCGTSFPESRESPSIQFWAWSALV